MSFIETFQAYMDMPVLELIATFTALLYVLLAAKGNILCWPMALVSTALYTYIFYDVYLWMDSVLQVYYFAMAIVGWINWRQAKAQQAQSSTLPINTWSLKSHAIAIGSLAVISLILGELMSRYTPTDFPYLDSATTVFAVFTTYLVVKRVLENWLYWVVIDLVSIYLYIEKDLQPTVALFVFYTGFAVYGYFQWRKMHQVQNNTANA